MTSSTGPDVSDRREADLESLLLPQLDTAYGLAMRLTRNAADAEDLVQEAALLACRGFRTFEPGSSFRAWFLRILTNCFYSKYRKRRREGTVVELEDTPELYLYCQTAALGVHTQLQDPAGAFMERLDAQAVVEALESLPDEYRVVASLYFIQDMAYQDIARTLEIPIGTVRSRLHRGRRMLQRALWRIGQDRGVTASLLQETHS